MKKDDVQFILDTAVQRGHMTIDHQGHYSLTDEGITYYRRLESEFGPKKRRPNGSEEKENGTEEEV